MRGRPSAALALAVVSVVGIATTASASSDSEPPSDSVSGASVIDSEWWAAAAEPYAGTTIHGVSESTPPSVFAAEDLAAEFEELTGISVELETTSWDEMRNKALNDMENNTGVYDFIYLEQDIVYADIAAERLSNLTELYAENEALQAPGFSWDEFNSFIDNFTDGDGNFYGVPMEAFIKVYLYRTDLFEDADNQAAFEEQYGYPLAPATTHEQYRDIAEFFTALGQDQGIELWGTTVQGTTSHAASFYEFFESVAPTFGLYNWGINPDENFGASVDNGGSMNSPEAVAALEWWLSLLEFAPPEATSSTWDEVASSFAAGRAAQGLVYGENATWIASDESRSSVVGNVGAALPPLAEGVLEAAESGEGYIGYYDGGAFAIPTGAQNKEAALLWLQFIGLPEVQPAWAAATGRVTEDATYEAPEITEIDESVGGYFTLMRESAPLFRGAPPYPFHSQVVTAVSPFIWSAILGDTSAQDALDSAAAAVEEELTNLGYRT
jgi:multiple sugar transport system substrate-binding protein